VPVLGRRRRVEHAVHVGILDFVVMSLTGTPSLGKLDTPHEAREIKLKTRRRA
jgi:hypothetical protein